MTRKIITAALTALLLITFNPTILARYAERVNPLIGTDFTGNTYPGAQVPHGMVQLSPDNGCSGWDRIAGYFYPDSTIAGFSHTHLSGTGAGDLYDISFFPFCGKPRQAAPLGVFSTFSHDRESARAGYYSVTLDDYGIDVELTATEHCGIQRYTWPGEQGNVRLNLAKAMNWDATTDTHLEIVDSTTVAGYRFSDGWAHDQKVWFATRFSKPFSTVEIDSVGGHIATFAFSTTPGESLVVATAISGVDLDGALANLAAEAPHSDFDEYLSQATTLWETALGKIEIETDDDDLATIFYTALYHSLLAPTVFSDVDGRYRGPDGKIHNCAAGTKHFSTFSLWDTYRAAHPLYTLLEPKAAGEMAQSLVDFGEQNDRLPVWNMWASETDMMIGYHSAPVIIDAIFKGLGDIDPRRALNLCVNTARRDDYRSIGEYRRLGYVPCDVDSSWSMSKTLEYAYDDHCIALLAKHLGDSTLYAEFAARAKNYANTFNPAAGFMQPRRSDGTFLTEFLPEDYISDICESNGWQYLWSVQHDIDGLKSLTGSDEDFARRLDRFFTEESGDTDLPLFSTGMVGQYAHGNEPSHHTVYLYNYCGRPHDAQRYLQFIMRNLYANSPAGLCGNDDCGQLSAWFVFSALGFYPVDPVSGEYQIGSPLFRHAKLHLDNGKTFEITANDANSDNIYITRSFLNGVVHQSYTLRHTDIIAGGELKFEMTNQK